MTAASSLSLLLVDDDVSFVRAAAELARAEGFQITIAGSVEQARSRLKATVFDLAIIDLSLPDGSGLDLIGLCDIAVTQLVLLTGQPTVESAIRAFKAPVLDYIIKPLDPRRYRELLASVAARKALPPTRPGKSLHGMVGASAAFRDIVRQIERVAGTDAAVLLHGEPGVGKEIAACAVHQASGRSGKLVHLACASLTADALALELFGREADGTLPAVTGHLEQADGGTLFLDEVDAIPPNLQAQLLRAIDTRRLRRIGGSSDIAFDTRIVAALDRPPQRAVQEGTLRDDLYYRLAEFTIAIPALRDRVDDIRPLASLFLERLNERYGTRKAFSAAAMEQLETHSWPGNARELRNAVNRAFILAAGDLIEDPVERTPLLDPLHETPGSMTIAVGMTFDEIERRMLFKTLSFFRDDKVKAAEALGISVKTIYNRLARYQPTNAASGKDEAEADATAPD